MTTKNTLPAPSTAEQIILQGVTTHNLKHIDLTLPKNKIITITGVSGSGKSSLAFHTIYKEWQFRYIESLSSYLRQFFNLGSRPAIEYSSGLSPAIAIEQNKQSWNSRSSVGTLTEIDDYLRLLYAKVWRLYSYGSWEEIKTKNVDMITQEIIEKFSDKKVFLLHELNTCKTDQDLRKFTRKNRAKVEQEKWFIRYLAVPEKTPEEAIEYFYLEEPNIPEKYYPLKVYGIYDRVTIEDKKIPRLKEDIIKILIEAPKFWLWIEEDKHIERYTDKNYDPEYNISYPEFSTRHFSSNRAEGACPVCSWLGEVLQVDMDKVLDSDSKYMRAILPWRDSNYGQNVLQRLAEKYAIDPDSIWHTLPERFRHVVLYGDKESLRVQSGSKSATISYEGISPIIKEQYQKWMLTVDFQAMLSMENCPECHGAKLRKESLHVFLTLPSWSLDVNILTKLQTHQFYDIKVNQWQDKNIKINIAQLQHLSIKEIITILTIFWKHSKESSNLLERILHPLMDRAMMIEKLWLGYLELHRNIGTISWWEIQRLRLTKQLWNKLTGIIYVLDEPTIGLNTKEILKVIDAIKQLREMGNTIVVVEHNEQFIQNSDRIVEIGPWAGDFGGELIFNGPYGDFIKQDSLTAQYISWKKKVDVDFEHTPTHQHITIKKAHKHNLKHIDVKLPLGGFSIITWDSWAGKTTLMYSILYRFLNEKQKFIQSYIRLKLLKQGLSRQEIIAAPVMKRNQYEHYEQLALQEFYKDIGVETITWFEQIDNTLYVDQSSIGKTPRSCPATFVGVFDDIRNLFAGTNDAKYLGFTAGHFSFNSTKGACPECKGYGYKKIELQFLPDTYVECELCQWTRYKPEITQIKRRDKSINQILDMYVDEAIDFFKEIEHIQQPLELMKKIGLGYIKLGQPAQMLSGGESQRLKLIKHFLKSYKGHTVYFLDEPTVGLHPADIEKLLRVLREFLNKWDTILMIEHDEDLLRFADKVIELDEGAIVKSH